MGIERLRDELTAYYGRRLADAPPPGQRCPLCDTMDTYAAAHPGLGPYALKAMQYEVIAEGFQPVVFRQSPFYFEMGTKPPLCDGTPWSHPGGWLLRRNYHVFRDANPEEFDRFNEQIRQRLFLSCGPYVDLDHHCPSFTNVLTHGLGGIYAQAEESLKSCVTREESEFVGSAMRGLLAVRRVAARFAEAAAGMLAAAGDESERRSLGLIARTAREVPWRPPATFYEGLNTLWFLREVCGSLEGIGTNSLGHPDRMLAGLYQRDLDAGRLTREEAYDLVCRFLLPADCRYDKNKPVVVYSDHELEITLNLGGCDDRGEAVCNDITFMFLEAHRELGLIYPKPHCRFGRNSPREYLAAINRDTLAGRSVVSLVNDDCLIPALVRAGKALEDARRYVCTGCWDVVVEGCENLPTGNYFSMPRTLEASIHDCPEVTEAGMPSEKLDGAGDFEEVYRRVFGTIIRGVRQMCEVKGRNGRVWPQANPSPFFSACLSDCLEKRRDYTAGGGRYNPHALPMIGFANVVDSLLVIRWLCFETRRHSLAELLAAVRANWEGHEPLRAEVLAAPHFGDNRSETNALAQRLHDDLYGHTRDLVNERGGAFELGYWLYREFRYWGEKMLATPDGRRAGDFLAHGITPSRLRPVSDVTSTIGSVAALDLTKCSDNSVVNILLPIGGLTAGVLDQFERAVAASKIGLLQLNCVSRDELLDARRHPEKHQDLVVRVCGFSAKFVALSPEWQEEFLSRNFHDRG